MNYLFYQIRDERWDDIIERKYDWGKVSSVIKTETFQNQNGENKWTGTFQIRYIMVNTHLKNSQYYHLSRKCKLKPQREMTTYLFKSLKFIKIGHTKYWQGCEENVILIHCWWEYKTLLFCKTIWHFLINNTNDLCNVHDIAIPLLGIKKNIFMYTQRAVIGTVIVSLFIMVRDWDLPKCLPREQWIPKSYSYNGVPLSSKTKQNKILNIQHEWVFQRSCQIK